MKISSRDADACRRGPFWDEPIGPPESPSGLGDIPGLPPYDRESISYEPSAYALIWGYVRGFFRRPRRPRWPPRRRRRLRRHRQCGARALLSLRLNVEPPAHHRACCSALPRGVPCVHDDRDSQSPLRRRAHRPRRTVRDPGACPLAVTVLQDAPSSPHRECTFALAFIVNCPPTSTSPRGGHVTRRKRLSRALRSHAWTSPSRGTSSTGCSTSAPTSLEGCASAWSAIPCAWSCKPTESG